MSVKVTDIPGRELKVSLYCPVCARTIFAGNVEDVRTGKHDGFIFTHDDVPHKDSDIDALEHGIN